MRLTPIDIATRLAETSGAIAALVRGVDARQASWKPSPERWSILDVVNHLADEEVEDFRTRLRLVLTDRAAPWPPIDPPGWVTERRYADRDLAESLGRFLDEREQSLDWLRELAPPDWTLTHEHPVMGPMTAGTIAASWMAHDLLHVRQITKLRYDHLAAQATPHRIAYAGTW